MIKKHKKLFLGIVFVLVFTIAGTYAFWQFQARRAVEALGNDSALIEQTEQIDVSQELSGSRLEISKIGAVMPIIESQSENALLFGAWRPPTTSTPENGGNTVIFGHRYLNLPPSRNTLFRLHQIEVGDTFNVIWNEKTYTYRITEKFVAEPTHLEVLRQTQGPTVTLITCTPMFTTKHRLIVRGELEL